MSNIRIPASIRDKATRDALLAICRELETKGTGSGDGASIEVQDADPTDSTPGETGDVIYATGTDSIWVFEGTAWDRASSGVSGVTVRVEAYEPEDSDSAVFDPTTWIPTSPVFKNNSNTSKALVVRVFEGSSEINYAGATFRWLKNSQNLYTPSAPQKSYSGNMERILIINGDDATDSSTDVFVCEVTY